MNPLRSVLSRYTNRGQSRSNRMNERQVNRSSLSRFRPNVEVLEGRALMSAGFLSAVSVGNDTGSSQARDIAVDAAGNTYMTGSYSGTTDFDPAHTHVGDIDVLTSLDSQDLFVAKYAADNTLIWARHMGGDSATQLQFDASGNVYVTGFFSGTADFGSFTRTSAGNSDVFIVKLNSSGTVQWANRWGTAEHDTSGGVGVDASGNVYALGFRGLYSGVVNPTLDVLKFKPNGNAVWTQSIVTRGIFGAKLAVDASGNAYVGGDYQGWVDFDPSSKTKLVYTPQSAGFVLKLTTAGKLGWVSPIVAQTGHSLIGSIALDGSGNVVAGGSYSGTSDFNSGAGTTILPSTGRAFITKVSNSGSFVWAKALEAASPTTVPVYGLAVDAAGNIYASGSFNGPTDFDPGAGTDVRTTEGGNDAYLLKLDAAGNYLWTETFGGSGSGAAYAVALDSAGTIHLAGSYRGTVDFDPDAIDEYWLTNPGEFSNLFLVKLTQA